MFAPARLCACAVGRGGASPGVQSQNGGRVGCGCGLWAAVEVWHSTGRQEGAQSLPPCPTYASGHLQCLWSSALRRGATCVHFVQNVHRVLACSSSLSIVSTMSAVRAHLCMCFTVSIVSTCSTPPAKKQRVGMTELQRMEKLQEMEQRRARKLLERAWWAWYIYKLEARAERLRVEKLLQKPQNYEEGATEAKEFDDAITRKDIGKLADIYHKVAAGRVCVVDSKSKPPRPFSCDGTSYTADELAINHVGPLFRAHADRLAPGDADFKKAITIALLRDIAKYAKSCHKFFAHIPTAPPAHNPNVITPELEAGVKQFVHSFCDLRPGLYHDCHEFANLYNEWCVCLQTTRKAPPTCTVESLKQVLNSSRGILTNKDMKDGPVRPANAFIDNSRDKGRSRCVFCGIHVHTQPTALAPSDGGSEETKES